MIDYGFVVLVWWVVYYVCFFVVIGIEDFGDFWIF